MTRIVVNEVFVDLPSPYAEYETDNPDYSEYGRRNYRETGYMSGSDALNPGYDPYHDYPSHGDADRPLREQTQA